MGEATERAQRDHATINDVARRAGLSVATVSRVMHDSPKVSQEAQRRVREAAATLGYMPNGLARGLVTRNTGTIGVLVSSIADPFWAEVVRGCEDRAQEHGCAVLIASSYEDAAREQRALDLFRQKRVDGVIVGASSSGPTALGNRGAYRLPVVFVNNEHIRPNDEPLADGATAGAEPNTYLVAGDDVRGAMLATTYLLSQGHRRCAYLGAEGRASSVHRLHGYRLALAEAGLPFDESLVVSLGEGAVPGELAAFRLLARRPQPTALFCYDDMTAVGALRAIRALNLHVPQDIAVVGFDDIPLAAYLDPALTTVRQPMHEMGQQAMTMLLDLVRGEAPPRLVTMSGELVIRSSVGLAPGEPS